MSQATMRKIDDRTVEIAKGDVRTLLTGPLVPRIWWWYEHQLGHGQAYADIYLAGLIDGLHYSTMEYSEKLLQGIRGRRQ